MKLSVSLPDEDVDVLDRYVAAHVGATRSSALRDAIALLRQRDLYAEYEVAFTAWTGSDDAAAWDRASGDGVEGNAGGPSR
jgi:Arc/MetJ-type ribon-helix-helix transcriptional regulator